MTSLLPALIAALLNLLLIPLVLVAAQRRGWYDQPEERKLHTAPTPRLGGVGIFWAFALSLAGSAAALRLTGVAAAWPVFVAMLTIHLLGLWDDFHNLRARFRFAVQLACALLVVAMGYRFRYLYLPGLGDWGLGALSYPLSVIWIVGVVNAVNMIDGMDGLSGGISILAAFSFGLIFMGRALALPALMAVILAGSLAGYLFYNFPPAKIFMGDSGSTFLGFILAVFPLMAAGRGGAPVPGAGFWLWDGVTVLAVPIFDVFAAMWRRARQGQSVMSPDKWHLHHKLLHLGFGTRAVLAMVYAACMALGAAAVSVLYLPPLAHWALVVGSWAILAALFTALHFAKERSLRPASES